MLALQGRQLVGGYPHWNGERFGASSARQDAP
jgi:hypothetical protein